MLARTLFSKPSHRQLLAPKLIMQLSIAQLSHSSLVEHIRSEIDRNPLLKGGASGFNKRIDEALSARNSGLPKSSPIFCPGMTVIADAEIRIRKNNIHVRLNDRGIPRLRVNPLYRKILENPDAPLDTKNFVREQLRKALIYIDAVARRRASLAKLIQIMADTQNEFLRGKTPRMKPLTISSLATQLDLHISTVSRIVSHKHVLINGETIPLRSLLSSPFNNSPSLLKKDVLLRLKEILREPTHKKPLSDLKISAMLQKEGVPIARRTVAKYRKLLETDL